MTGVQTCALPISQLALLTCSVFPPRGGVPNTYQVVELHGLAHTALELCHKLFALLQAHGWFWEGQTAQ